MAGKGGKRSTSFKPGQSGNPGGRPKQLGVLRDLARAYTHKAIANLIRIAEDPKAPHAAQVVANNSLLDRGWGKPQQEISATIRRSIDDFTDEELAAIASAGGAEEESDGSSEPHPVH